MSKDIESLILRKLVELKNPYPPDNLIKSDLILSHLII